MRLFNASITNIQSTMGELRKDDYNIIILIITSYLQCEDP